MIRRLAIVLIFICATAPRAAKTQNVTVGSKSFTENVILGEIITGLLESGGMNARHRAEIGGTRILWEALIAGDIDVYPEYTGTIVEEILAGQPEERTGSIENQLAAFGVRITRPLGFNNTYVLGVRPETAVKYHLQTISDLREHPDLKFGFSNEFMARGDGWPALRSVYNLSPEDARGIDHDLGYRALENGSIDVIDLYSTDAEIEYYNLHLLTDDLGHFPEYQAVLLYRDDRSEEIGALLESLEGLILETRMIQMNASAKIDQKSEAVIARKFLSEIGIQTRAADVDTWRTRLIRNTIDHLFLVLISLIAAIALAIPLGVIAFRNPRAGRIILGIVGAIYTIPSLALLVFMIPLLGIGAGPAIMALFLYSLLPIVFNTHSGLSDIPSELMDSARALGLDPSVQLRKIELPLATRSILTGIRTAAVINIGTATLGALIGAGGYGQPILTGIRLNSTSLILEGAIPAAVLALVVQYAFSRIERWLVPAGLRLDN